MLSSNPSTVSRCFDEEIKTCSVTVPTYLGRLILRTHHEDDTATLASIFSNSLARKHLFFLQPPKGWGNDEQRKKDKQWTEEDYLDRVNVQNETRSNGKSCVFNIILLASTCGETKDRCIGTTGYVTIDDDTGYLGIITDPNTTRMGYATEALYTSIVFAFEKLGITKITMLTNEINQEMRGWCENTAGLELINKKPMEINGYTFMECEYTFTLDQWNNSIKKKLENKMDQIKNQILSTNN
jgi:RimJ/RimL family protein N-acetyltransferase